VTAGGAAAPVIELDRVSRRFDDKLTLDQVSLRVERGEIHALLGPNGAGKTTLLRVATAVMAPSAGEARVLGVDTRQARRAIRSVIGLVPASDRSFYLRLSGLENLVFFARLDGFTRKQAMARAHVLLEQVGLADAARRRAGLYSHGMLKRLAIARALLADPRILLVDEATHDLDPLGARAVRDLVGAAAERGAAVIWTTQRLDEIRGFAGRVTLLHDGRAVFQGTVPALVAHAAPRRYLLRLRNGIAPGPEFETEARAALQGLAALAPAAEPGSEQFLVTLAETAVLGDAVTALERARIQVLSCTHERSEIEEAFISLTGEAS
jgi:ABC-type multidrug transport system ATPase subunit